jgi:hypothetical protein
VGTRGPRLHLCSKSVAFENSTTSREATQTAVETRSEFRYKFEAAAPQQTRAGRPRLVIPTSPMARQRPGLGERARPRVHQHAPPRAELKKLRPQAGGCFDKSGARRTRQRPRRARSPGPCTKSAAFENSTASCEFASTAVETRSEFRYKFEAAAPQQTHPGRPNRSSPPFVSHN